MGFGSAGDSKQQRNRNQVLDSLGAAQGKKDGEGILSKGWFHCVLNMFEMIHNSMSVTVILNKSHKLHIHANLIFCLQRKYVWPLATSLVN